MKKVQLKKELMLAYHSIWDDDVEVDLKEVLEGVPLEPAIEQIAYLLQRIVTRKKDLENFHPHELIMWILKLTGDTQKRATRFVTEQNPFTIDGFILTNRRVCLSLLQEILRCSSAPGDELLPQHQVALFKALLLLNSAYLRSQEKIFNWDGTGDEKAYLDIVLPSKISSLGINRTRDYQAQLIKADYFFEFCSTDPEYQPFLTLFLESSGFASYKQYIRAVLHPYLTYMANSEPSPKFRVDPDYTQAIEFFEQFSINDKEIVPEDFKTLRQFPLFRGEEHTFIFLFNNFFVDKLYQGFLFDFIQVINKAGHAAMNFGKLKTDMGNRFSEHWLFYRTIKSCFGNYGQIRKTGEELKVALKDGEPDYYIRDGRKVFLFEFKDVLLRADVKSSESADVIKEELAEKLDESTKLRPKTQQKAIRQLLNSISSVLSGSYISRGVDDFDSSHVMIYPILVHTDIALETEGVNYFLKERLNKLIIDAGLPKHRIKDMVIINIDMLLSIQDLFSKNKITLATCINEFITYANAEGPLNRMIPFDEFLKFYLMKKKHSFLTASDEFNRLAQSLADMPG